MKRRKRVTDQTFTCVCGHLAYWVKYKGWRCMCCNPRPLHDSVLARRQAF